MSGPIKQPLADVASVTPTLNDKAVTIQANTVRTSSYTAIYNLFKTGFDALYLRLTGGTMSGNIDMNNNQIKGLGEPTENGDAANKLYVDNQIGGASTLDEVLANGNTSALDASIGELGLLDSLNEEYGYISLNNGHFDLTNTGGKIAKLNTNLINDPKTFTFPDTDGTFAMVNDLNSKLSLTGGTMTGAIAMGTSKITGLGDPTANQDAATKLYVDTTAGGGGDKQDNYNLGNVGNSATTVTIDALSGVATFTQRLNGKSNAYYNINNTEIAEGDKIECHLYYTGAGFPIIMHYNTIAERIRLHIGNPAIDGGSGTNTNADLVVTFRKI